MPCRPLRLVHVGLDDTPVRLILGEEASTNAATGSIEYATLSYCWGKNELPLRTTRENLDQFSHSISPEIIPATFADALWVTRRLGIPYIWIDALCIRQDDDSEWQVEASRMDEIYSGSQITIAAEESEDSTSGCFPEKERGGFEAGEMFFHTQLSPPHFRPVDGQSDSSPFLVRIYKGDMLCRNGRSTRNTRGWTLQETFLTYRQVSLMSPDIHWACKELHTTECGVTQRGRPTLQQAEWGWVVQHVPYLHGEHIKNSWREIVGNYSLRQFTYPSDRVAAIAGAIRYMAKFQFHGDEAVLGLWKASFGNDLAWLRLTGPDESIVPQSVHKLPSWAWLASPGSAIYNFWYYLEDRISGESHIALLNHRITWTNTPYTSPLLSAWARVECLPLREIELHPFPAGARYNPPCVRVFGEGTADSDDDARFALYRCNAQLDHSNTFEGGRYTCMLIRSIRVSPDSLRVAKPAFAIVREVFLILQKVELKAVERIEGLQVTREEGESDILVYKRIGIAKLDSRPGEGAFDTETGNRVSIVLV
ncbi:Heterokaryon incompatibility protein (HET) domain containing protein [Naviculisporaceae sp. PSN 640]